MDQSNRKNALEGLFSGISNLLQYANDMVVAAGGDASSPMEARRTKSIGIGGLRTIAGVSVGVGPRVAPPRRRMATLRQNARKEAVIDDVQQPAVDVFDEADHFLVVAEVPGVEESAVHWRVTDGSHLTIEAESPDRKYFGDIQLSAAVDAARCVCCYANGVLELRLWKA